MRESTLLAAVPAAATVHDVFQSGTTLAPDNLTISEGHTVTSVTGAAPAPRPPWAGTGGDGNRRPAGIYFCRLRAGATVVTRKLMLVR
jgi:hypothetical protein